MDPTTNDGDGGGGPAVSPVGDATRSPVVALCRLGLQDVRLHAMNHPAALAPLAVLHRGSRRREASRAARARTEHKA